MFGKKMFFVLVLFGASNTYAGLWSVEGVGAFTAFGEDALLIGVAFPVVNNCDVARLGILGNDEITHITMMVDRHDFTVARTDGDGELAMLDISEAALRAIKHGRQMQLYTNVGWLNIDLTGSAEAITQAWENCVFEFSKTPGMNQLQASH